jgi:ribosomal protein L11 methyltransferase
MSHATPPDRWLVLEVPRPDDPELAGLVVEELMALPARGVVELEDGLIVYLPPPEDEDPDAVVDRLCRRIDAVLATSATRISHRWQSHEAWESTWREGLVPRRIGERLVVAPSWTDPELEPGELLVTVDPGMAFGTAEHPSTRGCLRLLDGRIEPGERVLDVGAGSGILSIAVARLGADAVVAVELDPWACRIVAENAELNGVEAQVSVRNAKIDAGNPVEGAPFDGIVANIEAGTLAPLLPTFAGALHPSRGWLIVGGILESEAAEFRDEGRLAGFRVEVEDVEDGWWAGLMELTGGA